MRYYTRGRDYNKLRGITWTTGPAIASCILKDESESQLNLPWDSYLALQTNETAGSKLLPLKCEQV